MKHLVLKIAGAFLAVFGLITLFLSGSIIFDLFGVRAKEGNYVLVVVWANFICSFLYLFGAYGFFAAKKWVIRPLVLSVIILVAASVGFFIHMNSGGLYETKTIGALIFRITVTLIFTALAYFKITKKEQIS